MFTLLYISSSKFICFHFIENNIAENNIHGNNYY